MRRFVLTSIAIAACLIWAHPAAGAQTTVLLGYVGPGAGLGAIGALLAVVVAVVLGIAGLVLYPIQLLRNWLSAKNNVSAAESTSEIETTV